MAKKYVVRLTDSERETLIHLIKKQRVAAQRVLRAQVLLKTDCGGPMWPDEGCGGIWLFQANHRENSRAPRGRGIRCYDQR